MLSEMFRPFSQIVCEGGGGGLSMLFEIFLSHTVLEDDRAQYESL